jgi:hypothetical protein
VRGAWKNAVSTDRQNSRYDTPGWVGSALCSTSVLGRWGVPYRTFVLLSPKRHLKSTWAGNPKPKRPRKRLGDWHTMSCRPCCLRRAASVPLFLKLTTTAIAGRPRVTRTQTPSAAAMTENRAALGGFLLIFLIVDAGGTNVEPAPERPFRAKPAAFYRSPKL